MKIQDLFESGSDYPYDWLLWSFNTRSEMEKEKSPHPKYAKAIARIKSMPENEFKIEQKRIRSQKALSKSYGPAGAGSGPTDEEKLLKKFKSIGLNSVDFRSDKIDAIFDEEISSADMDKVESAFEKMLKTEYENIYFNWSGDTLKITFDKKD